MYLNSLSYFEYSNSGCVTNKKTTEKEQIIMRF